MQFPKKYPHYLDTKKGCLMEFVIRLTKPQYKSVKLKSEILGYSSISAFVRDRLFKDSIALKKQVKEIHEIIVKNGKE